MDEIKRGLDEKVADMALTVARQFSSTYMIMYVICIVVYLTIVVCAVGWAVSYRTERSIARLEQRLTDGGKFR